MAAMITKNVIVELREKNAKQKTFNSNAADTNGDFSVTLPDGVDVEEGDLVSVSSVFIDDAGENSEDIVIEEDITNGSIRAYMYMMDNNTSETDSGYNLSPRKVNGQTLGDARTYHPIFEADPANRVHPDGELYFLSSIDDASVIAGTKQCNFFQFGINMLLNHGSDIPIFLKYKDFTGATIFRTIAFPYKTIEKQQSGEGIITVDNKLLKSNYGQKMQFPFDMLDGSLEFDFSDETSDKQMVRAGVIIGQPLRPETDDVAAGHHCSLFQKEVNFTIKKGTYKPEHLAEIITQQIVKISPTGYITGGGAQAFSGNEFFSTSLALKAIGDTARLDVHGAPANPGTIPFWIRTDGAKALQFSDTDMGGGVRRDYWCGASNFGLSYDGTRFNFTNLHNSIYHEHKPTVVGTQVGNRANTEQYLANKTGGLCFSSMSPPDLWFNKLGFSKDMLVHGKKVTCDWTLPGGHGGAGTHPVGNVAFTAAANADDFDNRIIEGINATGDLNGVDAIFQHDDSAAVHGEPDNGTYDIPGVGGLSGLYTAVIPTISLIGGDTNQLEEGKNYYQIEIDMGLYSEKLGANDFNNRIQAIVGRYFTTDNGTQSVGGTGSIEYIHKGETKRVSEFRVRILQPDGTLAVVGDDNAIFVSITKKK